MLLRTLCHREGGADKASSGIFITNLRRVAPITREVAEVHLVQNVILPPTWIWRGKLVWPW